VNGWQCVDVPGREHSDAVAAWSSHGVRHPLAPHQGRPAGHPVRDDDGGKALCEQFTYMTESLEGWSWGCQGEEGGGSSTPPPPTMPWCNQNQCRN